MCSSDLTGYPPSAVLQYPSIPAAVSALRPQQPGSSLPAWVAIPEAGSAGTGFLSSRAQSFATGGDPARPDFQVRDLQLFPDIDQTRMQRRLQYLELWDRHRTQSADRHHASASHLQTALKMASTESVRAAFDLQQEATELDRKSTRLNSSH